MASGQLKGTIHHHRAPGRGAIKASQRTHALVEEHAESVAGDTRAKELSETDHMTRFGVEEALWKAESDLRHPKERHQDPAARQCKVEERQHYERESGNTKEKELRGVEHRKHGIEGILREAEERRREAEDRKREAELRQREAERGQRQAEEAQMKALKRLHEAEEALARSEGFRDAMFLQTVVLQGALRETTLRIDTLMLEKAGFLGFSEFGVNMTRALVDEIDMAHSKLSMVKEELERSKEVIAKGEAKIEELMRVKESLQKQVRITGS